MANQRWPVDKNIKFINEYQRNECLWDPKHPQYKNRDAREAAYKVIMECMEMGTVKEVVTKIRILRNTYNNELLKAKKKITRRAWELMRCVYVSKIPWLTHMDFLKNIDSYTRENTENLTPNVARNTQEASVSESYDEEFTAPRTSRNKRKLKDPLLRAVDALEKVSSKQFSNNSGDDEFDLFGRTIAQQLRQLRLEAALETEEVILATIRQQRMKLLKQTTLSQRSTSSSVSECMESNRTITIRIPENQQVAQSSSALESIASTSTATNNDAEDEYYTYNEDILSQAVASISGSDLDRELHFDNY